nr:rho GTPase-activating protein 20-like [Microcebus murinus]
MRDGHDSSGSGRGGARQQGRFVRPWPRPGWEERRRLPASRPEIILATGSEIGKAGRVKVQVTLLLQFMLENCHRVFGEDIAFLYGEFSGTCGTRGNASDISHFHLSDSPSYESLENELNEDIYAPFSDVAKKLGKGKMHRICVNGH